MNPKSSAHSDRTGPGEGCRASTSGLRLARTRRRHGRGVGSACPWEAECRAFMQDSANYKCTCGLSRGIDAGCGMEPYPRAGLFPTTAPRGFPGRRVGTLKQPSPPAPSQTHGAGSRAPLCFFRESLRIHFKDFWCLLWVLWAGPVSPLQRKASPAAPTAWFHGQASKNDAPGNFQRAPAGSAGWPSRSGRGLLRSGLQRTGRSCDGHPLPRRW